MLNNQSPTHPLSGDGAARPSGRPPLWFVLRVLRPRLHPGSETCSCGACAHQVAVAARATGWTPEDLRAALGQAAAGAPTPTAGPRSRRALHSQVGSTATVVVSGRRVPAGVGLLHLAAAAESRS